MSLPHPNFALSAILAGLLVAVPVVEAEAAQPPDDDPGPGELEGDDDDDDDDNDDNDDDNDASKPPPVEDKPPPPPGTWGVGGTEEEGKYAPGGKTGKLKELEAEEEEDRARLDTPPELPPPGFAFLDTTIGFGSMVVVAQPTGSTTIEPTASFLIGIGYRIGDEWEISARFPISTGESNGPIEPFVEGARNPDAYTQIATGGLELAVKPHFILSRDMRLPIGLALVFPTASGDMYPNIDSRADLGKAIVNKAASASRGWEERALFAHQRMSIVPSGGVLWSTSAGPGMLNLGADLKLELMFDTGANDPVDRDGDGNPDSEVDDTAPKDKIHSTAINVVVATEVFYGLFDGLLSPGFRLWLAGGSAEESLSVVGSGGGGFDPGGVQFVFEPGIHSHVGFTESNGFGMDFRLGYMIPMGGELGGDNVPSASVGGLKLGAGFFF